MGRLQHVNGGEAGPLKQRCVLGRSRACTHRLTESDVSGEHALLRWTGSVWEVQDLHSRNGTFVDGRRLSPGERAALIAGMVLGFGRPESFVLVDADPPTIFAEPLDGEAPVRAQGGILALPNPGSPELMIFRGPSGWVVERGGEATPVTDGEVLRIGNDAWRLNLPDLLPQTTDSASSLLFLDNLTLRFHVSRDEEYVELDAVHGSRSIDLKARSHHYTLLVLARARLRDLSLAPDRQGWMQQSDLLDLLRVDASHLHLNIYRLRQQFGEAGILNAARIVERRAGTRQLRIGVAKVELHTLEPKR
jgi:hypothetical protein